MKVLEFSTMITASLAAMMMGEQGASVIKVEPVEVGDPMRHLGSSKGGMSALFANCNRGKQSLGLDLKSAEARTVVERLAAEADVLLCNYRPGVMDKLGFGSGHLRARNPRLIYCAISGLGTEGPDPGLPAYVPIVQAQAGFAAVLVPELNNGQLATLLRDRLLVEVVQLNQVSGQPLPVAAVKAAIAERAPARLAEAGRKEAANSEASNQEAHRG